MPRRIISTPLPQFDVADPSTYKINLARPRPSWLKAIVASVEDAARRRIRLGLEPPALPFQTNGWYDIGPAQALPLLLRNHPGANRPAIPAAMVDYGRQMVRGEWIPISQGIGLDESGKLLDGQNRLYGCLISGATFRSQVTLDVPVTPGSFTVYDQARTRTTAMSLQTAGYNGVAGLIGLALRVTLNVRSGAFEPNGGPRVPKVKPQQAVRLMPEYPNLQPACRSTESDWSGVPEWLGGRGRKPIVAYLGMRIIDLHGEEVADQFMEAILDEGPEPGSAVDSLRRLIARDHKLAKTGRPMKERMLLGCLILAFNAWFREVPLGRRWELNGVERFPALVGDDQLPVNEPDEDLD